MRVVTVILTLLYPYAVYLATSRGYFGCAAGLLALILILKLRSRLTSSHALLSALCLGALAVIFSNYAPALPLYYPIVVNLGLLVIFASSLLRPPCVIERLAALSRGPLPPEGRRYCRRVCVVWVIFFAVNGLVAYDSLHRSLSWWLLYNGCISYVAMGSLFVGEYLIRLRVMKRALPLLSVPALLGALMLAPSAVVAEPSPDIQAIRQHLTPPSPFRSTFRESRHIAALTAPLESEGEMRCLPQKGIVWRIRRPIERTTVITPSGLTIVNDSGARETVTDRANISSALLSLMGGAVEEAEENFTVTTSGSVNAWSITLSPKDTLVAEIVLAIVVRGSSRPETLEVHHANGDKVVTTFTEPKPLSENEIQELRSSLHDAL